MVILYLILVAVLFVGFVWVVVQTIRGKGKMGINVQSLASPLKCPRCGQTAPRVRAPKSASELLWGGWTCSNCGARIDKWGKEKA